MLKSSSIIKHPATIVDLKRDRTIVKIDQVSACGQCHAKNSCSMAERTTKIIEINGGNPDLKIGQTVTVLLKESQGQLAVIFGYVLPCVVLLFSLLVCFAVTGRELFSSMLSLFSLMIYYFVLWTQRTKIQRHFNFSLEI